MLPLIRFELDSLSKKNLFVSNDICKGKAAYTRILLEVVVVVLYLRKRNTELLIIFNG